MRGSLVTPLLPILLLACGGGGLVNNQTKSTDTADSTAGTPNLVLDKLAIDFGAIELNSSASETLTITNNGTAELNIAGLDFSDAAFTATAGAGLQVAAGSTTTLGITFTPTDYAEYAGTLTITTNDPDTPTATIDLAGSVITDSDGDGYDSEAAGGDDCDDSDPDIHPGAEDAWYDGVDSDCDGSDDWDQDGDGEGSHGHGNDCDDLDPDVNSEATESFNGIDDDCDGEVDQDAVGGEADVVLTGVTAGDEAGASLTMGDLDGDGAVELIIGAPAAGSGRGMVAVFGATDLPSATDDIESGANAFVGDGSRDALGTDVAYLSAFAEGGPYLAVGSPGAGSAYGSVYVIPGDKAFGSGDTDDATVIVSGDGTYEVGTGIGQGADLDADGLEELYGWFTDSTGSQTSYIYLLYGDASGSYTTATVDAAWSTNGDNTLMRHSVPTGGDLDGDGYDDMLWCDHLADLNSGDDDNSGFVWVLFGRTAPYQNAGMPDLGDAAAKVIVGDDNERVGWMCAIGPDLDGDGDDELWVMNRGGDADLYVIPGSTDLRDGGIDPAEEAMVVYTMSASSTDPLQFRRIGDWTGDGISEMALGRESSSSKAGQVWVYSSEVTSGTWAGERDAFGTVYGDSDEPYYQSDFGYAISALPGDLDGDGYDDFVVGDPGYTGSSGADTDLGAVFINFNRLGG